MQAACGSEAGQARFETARAFLAAQGHRVRIVDRRELLPRYQLTLRPGFATRADVLALAIERGFTG